jgi:hypothetical protein
MNPQNNNRDVFCYDIDEAVKVVWANIPQNLRDQYEFDEIYFIIELLNDYLDFTIGIKEGEELPICQYPVDIDEDEMRRYIIRNSIDNDIFLTYEELEEILAAELIYYEINGATGDAGQFLN